ncbi:MAG: tetratricopeptide repeat protein [Xenococcaceae cyanobacterium MO_207.B15]|nr:tetratricopeptide repeat protein [Xenococcaceae cyanobacterium MO_207.B15]
MNNRQKSTHPEKTSLKKIPGLEPLNLNIEVDSVQENSDLANRKLSDTPYIGLNPYSEKDADFFFGRQQDIDIITKNLRAWRLTVLYGDSGVGKSSVLRAGVVNKLRQEIKQNLEDYGIPKLAVVVFPSLEDKSHGKENFLERLFKQIETGIKKFQPDINLPERQMSLVETLKDWAQQLGGKTRKGKLFVILDQFEQYLLKYSPKDKFASEFVDAINDPFLPVNFLISIRTESLAKLDYFKELIEEDLLKNRLELKPLNEESAREAIIKPIEKYNEQLSSEEKVHYEGEKVDDEKDLVKEVLEQIDSEGDIQTPYLQLVMKRLWEEEVLMKRLPEKKREDDLYCLRLKTLKDLGHVLGIINDHINNKLQLVDKEAVARTFYYLVTPSCQRIAYSVSDLAFYTGLKRDKLGKLLEKLADADNRILRTVKSSSQTNEQRYEIFYDALAQPILEWLKRYSLKTLRKNEFEYWYEEARDQKNNKHYEEAINYYDQALKISPQDYDSLYGRGSSLEELGREQKRQGNSQEAREFYRKAIESFNQALEAKPKNSKPQNYWAWNSRGCIELYELEQYDKAIESFNQALEAKPNDDKALRRLDEALRKAGRYE